MSRRERDQGKNGDRHEREITVRRSAGYGLFGAVSLRFEAIRLQIWLLALAAMAFVAAVAITATFPIEL